MFELAKHGSRDETFLITKDGMVTDGRDSKGPNSIKLSRVKCEVWQVWRIIQGAGLQGLSWSRRYWGAHVLRTASERTKDN